jgi:hypothetical protein
MKIDNFEMFTEKHGYMDYYMINHKHLIDKCKKY